MITGQGCGNSFLLYIGSYFVDPRLPDGFSRTPLKNGDDGNMKCEVCKYSVTPRGKQCYTLTKILTALPSWKLIPKYVIPIMEDGCKRFRPR